jgi:hypothetical protein
VGVFFGEKVGGEVTGGIEEKWLAVLMVFNGFFDI